MGRGCDAVGRGPEFESSHRQLLLNIKVCIKDEIKRKRGRDWPIFLKS